MPEAKYTSQDMTIMQSWPLERKVRVTQLRIMEWVQHWNGEVYISFSGGKDSTVLLDLARRIYPEIPAVFVDTGLEFPEIRAFVKRFKNVIWLKPQMTFKQVIEKYGYPAISKAQADGIHCLRIIPECVRAYRQGFHKMPIEWLQKNFYNIPFPFFKYIFGINHTDEQAFVTLGKLPVGKYALSEKWLKLIDAPFDVSKNCCHVMKKAPVHKYERATGRKPILATMASESLQRQTAWQMTGCNGFNSKSPKSKPMSFWTEQDVLQYLRITKTPYCSVYGDIVEDENGSLSTTGCSRTGCMGCLFGCHLEKEPNRLQRLKITHPKVYDYLFRVLDYGMVCDYIGIPY